ncbi:MAG TPA: type 4a pilus biogenesis protein PilO [Clostridia bacterium]|nr:type 4a pilus biogenesis protein PilO [Clostridia bacterium]
MKSSIMEIEIQPKDLMVISIAIVPLILFGLLLWNQWAVFSTAQQDLKDEIAINDSLYSEKNLIIDLKAREDDLIRDFRLLEYMIPEETEYGDIIQHLQSVFLKHNLHVIRVKFDESVEKEGYIEIPIHITVNGQYEHVIGCLKDFKFGDRPFRVDEFYIDRESNTISQIHCDILSYAFFKTSSD